MRQAFRSGLHLGEIFFPVRLDGGAMVEAVARACAEGEYEGVEIADLADRSVRLRIGELARAHRLRIAVWQVERQLATEWGMTSIDAGRRRAALTELKKGFEHAVEIGGTDLLYIGDLDPGPELRESTRKHLADALADLAEAAAPYGLRIVFEPVDRGVHERGLIGRTEEAVAMIDALRGAHRNLWMAWDTSHAALSGDDLDSALRLAYPMLVQMHLANVVVDLDHEDYGDHHRFPGPPGLLTTERIASIFHQLAELRDEDRDPPFVSFEVRAAPGDDPWAIERRVREIRDAAWRIACAEKT